MLADLAARKPTAMLAACVAALGLATGGALGATDDLPVGSMRLDAEPRTGPDPTELSVILEGPIVKRDPRVARVSEDVVAAQLEADPAVVGVRRADPAGDRIALVPDLGDADDAERRDAMHRLETAIDPGPLDVRLEGELPRLDAGRDQAGDELWRPLLLVLPLGLLAVWLTAGIRGVLAASYCAALSIFGSLALMRLLGLVADVSLLGLAAAAPVGLVLGTELAVIALRQLDEGEGDLTRMASVAGATAALSALGLLVTSLDQAGSLVLGCALATLLAGLGATCFVPALVIAAAAVDGRDFRILGRILAAPVPDTGDGRSPAGWIATRIATRPLVVATAVAVAVVALVAAALPLLDAVTAPFAARAPIGADSLIGELPAAAGLAALAAGAVAVATLRAPLVVILGMLTVLPAAAALGLAQLLFVEKGTSAAAELIEVSPRAALDTGAAAAAAAALVAIAAARTALTAWLLRADLRLGIPAAPAAYLVTRALVPGALAATLVGGLAAGAMASADLGPAEELGVILALGLVADLVLVRVPAITATAWLASAQIRWRRWPLKWRRAKETGSAS